MEGTRGSNYGSFAYKNYSKHVNLNYMTDNSYI